MEQAKQVVDALMEELSGRRGFKAVISDMDLGTAQELRQTLVTKAEALLATAGEDLKADATVAREALRQITISKGITCSTADRIEAAKVLLGRG